MQSFHPLAQNFDCMYIRPSTSRMHRPGYRASSGNLHWSGHRPSAACNINWSEQGFSAGNMNWPGHHRPSAGSLNWQGHGVSSTTQHNLCHFGDSTPPHLIQQNGDHVVDIEGRKGIFDGEHSTAVSHADYRASTDMCLSDYRASTDTSFTDWTQGSTNYVSAVFPSALVNHTNILSCYDIMQICRAGTNFYTILSLDM